MITYRLDDLRAAMSAIYKAEAKLGNKNNPKAKKKLAKIIPLKRVGQPEDIANAALFLLSDQSKYITGTELIVDGGITSKPNSY